MRIEKLPPERWREYRELRLEALLTEPAAFGARYEAAVQRPDEWWIECLQNAQTDARRTILFAVADERLVGMAGAYPEDDPANVNIVSMYVAPSHRGQGVGTALLQAVVDEVQGWGVRLCVNDDQPAAVSLYRRFGFETIAETPMLRPDGSPYRQLFMALRR